jgi:hypothetical protein
MPEGAVRGAAGPVLDSPKTNLLPKYNIWANKARSTVPPLINTIMPLPKSLDVAAAVGRTRRPVGRRLLLDYLLPGVATIVAVVPVGVWVRTDAKHAVDAANDATSGSANDAADHAADRSEHAVARISAAISSVVNTRRHALRVRGEWQRKKKDGRDYAKDFHAEDAEALFCVTPRGVLDSQLWRIHRSRRTAGGNARRHPPRFATP